MLGNLWVLTIVLPLPARPLALGEFREDILPRKRGLETSLRCLWLVGLCSKGLCIHLVPLGN